MEYLKHNENSHNIISGKYNNKHSEIYNDFEQKRLEVLISEIVEFAGINKDLSVLDFGAGTGNLTLKFLQLNCKVTAADVSEKSLQILKSFSRDKINLTTQKINTETLPFENDVFDIVSTYSVLHHIPDFLFAVNEMIRVCKPGGFIYIDHEANQNNWNPDENLKKWKELTKISIFRHFINLIKTRELFTLSFVKTVFIKIFINKRYEREGDIHVWPDDHINWNEIKHTFFKLNCVLIKEENYLMYKNNAEKFYPKYKDICNDTKFVIFKKNNAKE